MDVVPSVSLIISFRSFCNKVVFSKHIYDVFLFYFKLILMIDDCYIYVVLSIWWIHEITIWSLCILHNFKCFKFSAKSNHMNVTNARRGLFATPGGQRCRLRFRFQNSIRDMQPFVGNNIFPLNILLNPFFLCNIA